MRRRLGLLMLVALGLAVTLSIGGAWWLSGRMLFPPWYEVRTPDQGFRTPPHFTDPLEALGLAFEDVEFLAVDGSVLRGWLVPGRAEATSGVVAVHGGGGDRRQFLALTPVLHDAGYPVLLFDCREQGISEVRGRGVSFGVREHADTSSAVDYLQNTLELQRIAVIGTSQGAASAIIAAALDPGIDVVIAENSFTDLYEMLRDTRSEAGTPPEWLAWWMATFARWRLDAGSLPSPREAIARIAPRPILLMHGTADVVIPATHSQRLLDSAGAGASLWLAEGAEHSQLIDAYPTEFRARVTRFLAQHLGPAAPSSDGL